jgi:transcriptional regulator with GAF, ATPase, and Fis domain
MNDADKTNHYSNTDNLQSQTWHSSGDEVTLGDLQPPSMDLSLRSFRNKAEIQAISRALAQTGWNRKRAARLLRISYRGLLYKIRRHNITRASQGPLQAAPQGT